MGGHSDGEHDGDGTWCNDEWIPDDIPWEDDDGNYIEMDVPDDAFYGETD
jgi:hypothetical protein